MSLEKFIEDLPKSKKTEWTFLETIGVAHRETIMAKLLAYYFKSEEEHGLGDLFIRALLKALCCELDKNELSELPVFSDFNFDSAEVKLEDKTDNNKRIDIVISTDNLVIAIEFKINHTLNNPLNDYIDRIEGNNKDKKHKYYIVLTPNRKEPEGKAKGNKKFKQVMLSHFIEKVEDLRIEKKLFLENDNSHQSHIYRDFVRTIENRKHKIEMLKKYFELVKNDNKKYNELNKIFKKLQSNKEINSEEEKEVLKDLKYIQKIFENKINELNKLLEGFQLLKSSKEKLESVIYKKNRNNAVTVKVRLSLLNGWSIEKWEKETKLEESYSDYYTDLNVLKEEVNKLI